MVLKQLVRKRTSTRCTPLLQVTTVLLAATLSLTGFVSTLEAQPQATIEVLLRLGDVPVGANGDPVNQLGRVDVGASGEVGVTLSLDDDGDFEGAFVVDGELQFRESQGAPFILGSLALSDPSLAGGGSFLLRLSTEFQGSLWKDGMLFLREGDAAPGLPGQSIEEIVRSTLSFDGSIHFKGRTTDHEVFYRSATGAAEDFLPLLKGGDVVQGFAVERFREFDVSSDGIHRLQGVVMETASTANDDFLLLDGAIIARESLATFDGDNWKAFDLLRTNSSGTSLFYGFTDADLATNSVLVVDNVIQLREGDQIGSGQQLTSPAYPVDTALHDKGWIAHLWNSVADQRLFFSCSADLRDDSVEILTNNQLVDSDGDTFADGFTTSLQPAPFTTLHFIADTHLVLVAAIDFGNGSEPMVIKLPLPECPEFADGFESGDTTRWSAVSP